MSELPDSVRNITDKLDAVGNTTAAIGKGFAIGSAALTALALFATYSQVAKLDSISLLSPMVIIGLFIGAMFLFLFSAMTMNSVGKAANQMIEEVRRQFREDAGIMEGTSNTIELSDNNVYEFFRNRSKSILLCYHVAEICVIRVICVLFTGWLFFL